MFEVTSFPLYEKETGESDVGGGIFKVGLKGDIVKLSIDSSIHIVWL